MKQGARGTRRRHAAGRHHAARRHRVARSVILGIALILAILPIAWTLLASVGVRPDNAASPPTWSLPPTVEHYAEVGAAERGFWPELGMSAATSSAATLLATACAFLAAWGLAHSILRRKARIAQLLLVLASIPVMAYAIPLDEVMRGLGLHDTFIGVVAAQAAILAPLATFILTGYLFPAPLDTEEAAVLDGARPLQVLGRVVLPAHIPGVLATAVIVFILSWNSFLVPMVLTTHHVRTIPIAMSDFFTLDRELEWPSAAAALIVSFLPLAALIAVSQRVLRSFVFVPRGGEPSGASRQSRR